MSPEAVLADRTAIGADQISSLRARYLEIRRRSEWLVEPLTEADMQIQSMADTSPIRWHLGHTNWFFDTFLLRDAKRGAPAQDARWSVLFNSYYNAVGEQYPRHARGLISRPGVAEILDWRKQVDTAVLDYLENGCDERGLRLVEIGLQHEQQHQELMLTDIKHALFCNPLFPAAYPQDMVPDDDFHPRALQQMTPSPSTGSASAQGCDADWLHIPAGLAQIGAGSEGFAFDNEGPRHSIWQRDASLSRSLVTNSVWLEFIADGAYANPLLWLADGWAWVQREQISAPLYWLGNGDDWTCFTLHGVRELNPRAPVCHISYYEADALATWAGLRLPTEMEWELAAQQADAAGCDQVGVDGWLHQVWQWTGSAYAAYPGFRPAAGAVGEYNGKFMCNQQVLRGSACTTAPGHSRLTYRNFFYPHQRWQMTGVRLAALN